MRLFRFAFPGTVVAQPASSSIPQLTGSSRDHTDSPGIGEWFTVGRFGLLLAVFIFCMFPDVLLGTSTFVFRDFSAFGYPLAHYHRECFWRGEIPLWNPLNSLGLPFLAQWNTMVLYPLSLFYLVFPLPWSLPMFCLGHMWLAGIGMYLLAWRWTGHRLGAVVAGLGFAFNGFTLNCLMWPNYMAGLGWMPLVVYAVEEGWRRGGRWVIYAAVFGAMQMLSGVPEVILFTWFIAGMLWLFCGGHDVGWFVSGRRWLGITLLVTGLSAAQLLPFVDLLAHSHRGTDFASQEYEWALPVWGWANLLVPLFRTHQKVCGIYFQQDQYITSSCYLGIGLVAMALIAAWKVRDRRVCLLGFLAMLGLVLALGKRGYLLDWLQYVIPQLGFIRYPAKYVILPVFVIPVLAACAIRWLLDVDRHGGAQECDACRKLNSKVKAVLWVGGILLLLIAAIACFAHRFPFRLERWPVTFHSALTRAGFLVLILVAVLGLRVSQIPVRQLLFAAAVMGGLWLDIWTHTPWQNPTAEPVIYGPLPRSALFESPPVVGQTRAMLSLAAMDNFARFESSLSTEAALGRRLGLDQNRNLLEAFSKTDGSYALYLPEEFRLREAVYSFDGVVRPNLLDFLGVAMVSSTNNPTEWESRTGFMPLVSAGQQPLFAEVDTAFVAVTNLSFRPREVVYLPASAKGLVKAERSSNVSLESRKMSAHEVQITVNAERPAMVVVAQAWYHWWKARIDSKPVPLWKANYGFQAVEVPPGKHEVRISYEDQGFRWGAGISLFSILLVAAALVWMGRGSLKDHSGVV